MGRRKWKTYQDSLAQSHVNATDLLAKHTPTIGEFLTGDFWLYTLLEMSLKVPNLFANFPKLNRLLKSSLIHPSGHLKLIIQ